MKSIYHRMIFNIIDSKYREETPNIFIYMYYILAHGSYYLYNVSVTIILSMF